MRQSGNLFPAAEALNRQGESEVRKRGIRAGAREIETAFSPSGRVVVRPSGPGVRGRGTARPPSPSAEGVGRAVLLEGEQIHQCGEQLQLLDRLGGVVVESSVQEWLATARQAFRVQRDDGRVLVPG